ncbi:TonB-dependent receptor domain-containing protein [Caulobacter mirabilis]|uniref:TonB-dependent heme/hemoglobin receptor family protein n=1 Tax=Caulobacter mirabilis TaxID=69666 RepID=A0A2D2AY59_9CAUL|nr:TonB-dependent receptor [Caulobacter mirabilis]ATQ42956.1 TonB-dependent heme/hemoglobin receptor family protein [Caulobacter mirabilis]
MRTSLGGGKAWVMAALMGTTAIGAALAPAAPAQAQAEAETTFDIPAQPLGSALADFSRATGVDIVYGAPMPAVSSPGVSGRFSASQGLSRLLAGSGLTYRFTGPDAVRLEAAPRQATSDGVIALGAVRVEGATAATGGLGAGEGLTDDDVYSRAAPVAHISAERIDRFRGASPADIFRGTPGVLSGEARNGAGAVDLNIRGLQGFGRVTAKIDGAENAVTIYQGYQGVSNRTFIDPDFIAGVDVTKGADAASFGNAGSVAIRTLDAKDIVREGEAWGLRIRGGLRGNSSDPVAGNLAGYAYRSGVGTATPSPTGLDRPGALEPTSSSASIIGAYSSEAIDLLAGYTFREQGNYHAGEHGSTARPVNIGDTKLSWGGIQKNTMINAGLANYRPGEEVLNTQLETESWLLKATARFGDGQTVQLGYNAFRSEAGDRLASRQTSNLDQPQQQAQTAGVRLDSYTARYLWAPSDSDLIEIKANAYWSHLELRNPIRGGRLLKPEDLGMGKGFRVGSDSDLWGVDVSNRSRFFLDQGDLELTYGLSYRGEDTRGSAYSAELEGWNTPRDGFRHEVAGFAKGAFSPRDWLTINGGLRYTHYWSEDRFDPYEPYQVTGGRGTVGFKKDDGGFSPSVGLVLKPADWAQVYVSYSSTLRAPGLTEAISAFNSFSANAHIKPERSNNWELGASAVRDGLFVEGDRLQAKLGYFNWTVDDYIARNVRTSKPNEPYFLSLNMENIHRARFEGLEFNGRYELGGLTADLAANYYLNVEYCRTADTCGSKSLYGDYATNHVPPEYSVELSLSQRLAKDRLTLGGRAQHTGPRAIGHGDVTAQGASQFVSLVNWKPFTLVDLFADYRITDSLTASLRVENLFDRFYMDPLGLVTQPGPGRTVSFSLTQRFGGDQTLPWLSPFEPEAGPNDWTGLYLGAHGGGSYMTSRGKSRTLDGTASPAARRESADWEASGPITGLQAGYNWQLPSGWVVGLEADWSRTSLRDRAKVLSPDPVLGSKGYRESVTSTEVDWTASLRARIGYAVTDRLMAYGSAGVAVARERQVRDQYVSDYAEYWGPMGSETWIFFSERVERTRKGVSATFGAEYAMNSRWSLRAEYAYSAFGKQNFDFQNARAGTGKDYSRTTETQIGTEIKPPIFPADDPICSIVPSLCLPYEGPVYRYETTHYKGSSSIVEGRRASNDLDLHVFRVGLNYRF